MIKLIDTGKNTPRGRTGSFLEGVLIGLVTGSVLGVLFAPRRGDITRRKIRRKVEDTRDRVSEEVENFKG